MSQKSEAKSVYAEVAGKVIRHGLGLLAAALGAKEYQVDPASIEVIACGLTALGTVLWSLWKVKKAK